MERSERKRKKTRLDGSRKLALFEVARRVAEAPFDMVFVGRTHKRKTLHFYFHGLVTGPVHENKYLLFCGCAFDPQKPYRNALRQSP